MNQKNLILLPLLLFSLDCLYSQSSDSFIKKAIPIQNALTVASETIVDDTVKYEYSISGKITECGNPLEGVVIESRDKTFYTDVDGKYDVRDTIVLGYNYIKPDSVILKFSKPGYIINLFGSGSFVNIPTNIMSYFIYDTSYLFQKNDDFTAIKETNNLSGCITYVDNTPLGGIPINIKDTKTGDLFATTTTDLDGTFIVPVVFPKTDGLTSYSITPVYGAYSYKPFNYFRENYISCEYLENLNFKATIIPTPICVVSVSESGKNIVVWEKPEIDVITSFNIYSEGDQAGTYELLGTVPYKDLSIFEDINSDPRVKAYRYRLGTVTTFSGSDTASDEHKTIHLMINKGQGDAWNLVWSSYEGLAITTYKLYRGTSADNMTFMADIAGSLNSYTDLNAPAETIYYQIEMILESACNPEVAKPISKSTKTVYDYFSTKSNTVNTSALSGIDDVDIENVAVYPNPVGDILFLPNEDAIEYEIYSVTGTIMKQGIIKESIDVSDFQKGIYFLRINKYGQLVTYKFIK